MKEKKKQQPTTSKKSSHNTLDWVEKQLRDVVAFDMGISIHQDSENRRSSLDISPYQKPQHL